uniref:Small ribosomal subunit protein uS3c n=1 Tax=Borodinellopsis insignis TaxID=3229915 RepID=A0AB39U418_9CHLO
MGQKVHPLGFRVGITKKHQSQWFARFNKYKYSQSVLEDRMLRETLTSLFGNSILNSGSESLNPILKNTQINQQSLNAEDTTLNKTSGQWETTSAAGNFSMNNRGGNPISSKPKITQIKIERGLIPYEIGIQIYAENCDLIKSAIDNLKINRDLICKLQKARRYLSNLKVKLQNIPSSGVKDFSQNNNKLNFSENSYNEVTQKQADNVSEYSYTKKETGKKLFSSVNNNRSKNLRFKSRLTKQEQRIQRFIKKRLKKRQSIRRRYSQLIFKGLFLQKKGNKISLKIGLNLKNKKTKKLNTGIKKEISNLPKTQNSSISNNSTFGVRIKKKFVTIYLNKMNKKFLNVLKDNIKNCYLTESANNIDSVGQPTSLKVKDLGFNKKWSLKRLNSIKNQPLTKLTRLIAVLEQRSLIKLESLRKEFIAFGSISKTQSLGYYQIVNFLKHLKFLVNKIKQKQKLQIAMNKISGSLPNVGRSPLQNITNATHINRNKQTLDGEGLNNLSFDRTSQSIKDISPLYSISSKSLKKLKQSSNEDPQSSLNLTQIVLTKKLHNIEDECRKIKFIEYLKQIVRKHRTNNIYFYLSTIADARKDLKKIQQFTKRHANFLFGLDVKSLTKNIDGQNFSNMEDQVTRVLQKTSRQFDLEKTLQDVFLEQLEKQRSMCKENAQLIPKISLKFYSVKAKSLEAKASVISESVVDALEKRKAFRKVIKDAKESLMRIAGVKGVKIQVAGRLNGAEIARTEWVRAGRVPLQTLRANLDYSYRTANTIYGIIGVKVWIFKGYTKLITQ